jgi:hypothetical protein
MSSGVKPKPSGPEGSAVHDLLLSLGYKLVEDVWGKDGATPTLTMRRPRVLTL